ncbi:siderophore-interacting protein [Actinoplanes sp. NPDC051470]|uniref:siderophore-interacting protein n=1 Tax=unclassified Actinoplanes TaxID=2626549 RepID=UPI00343DD6F5
MKKGWEGLVIKAFGGRDFRLTVLGAESVNDHYHRLHIDGGDLLQACDVHPTMWLRLWFELDGKPHQRAFTLVDPDPSTGRFHLEFVLHDSTAAGWARAAKPGDTIEATLLGSDWKLPDPSPAHLLVVGDATAIPAVNSIFDASAELPATVWLEYANDDEKSLPLRNRPDQAVTWVPRERDGQLLVETVTAELPRRDDAFYWVACEAGSTRAIAKHIRRDLAVDKHRVRSLAYWTAAR